MDVLKKKKEVQLAMGLIVEHINKSFGNFQAIKDLSMEVREGAVFGFLGANGAGKTTTMRMILDIIRPDTGRITWNGKDVREVPRHNWGYLPEERGLYPKMIVEDQLLFLARLNGLSKQAAIQELDEWLERFQIQANRKRKVEDLSKGNQQKVQFLATIMHNPAILIMDEPFSGLDPVNANVLKEAFLEMHQRGKTIIFSTHQLEQVEEMCEDIVIINKGQALEARVTAASVLISPAHPLPCLFCCLSTSSLASRYTRLCSPLWALWSSGKTKCRIRFSQSRGSL
jgi:ABC-2 type transport system ATP-binding protein